MHFACGVQTERGRQVIGQGMFVFCFVQVRAHCAATARRAIPSAAAAAPCELRPEPLAVGSRLRAPPAPDLSLSPLESRSGIRRAMAPGGFPLACSCPSDCGSRRIDADECAKTPRPPAARRSPSGPAWPAVSSVPTALCRRRVMPRLAAIRRP